MDREGFYLLLEGVTAVLTSLATHTLPLFVAHSRNMGNLQKLTLAKPLKVGILTNVLYRVRSYPQGYKLWNKSGGNPR
jgi:hypothetical protein